MEKDQFEEEAIEETEDNEDAQLENDEISPEEEGFIKGYEEFDKQKEDEEDEDKEDEDKEDKESKGLDEQSDQGDKE